jgi:cation transport ATPase
VHLDEIIVQEEGEEVQVAIVPKKRLHWRLRVRYNPVVVKAQRILQYLKNKLATEGASVTVYNPHLEAFKMKREDTRELQVRDLIYSLIIALWYVLFALFLPQLDFMHPIIAFPCSWNLFSIYLLVMTGTTAAVVARYGLRTFRSAILNWWHFNSLSMDTLITLGSIASLLMAIFLAIIYAIKLSAND